MSLISDAQLGWRRLRKEPRFFLLVMLLLVLGNGASTAMFSVTRALLLRPLPYRDPEQLVVIWGSSRRVDASSSAEHERGQVPTSAVEDWATRSRTLAAACSVNLWLYSLSDGEQPTQIALAARVSGAFFPLLGLQPLLGRLIAPEDDRAGQPITVVLGAERWRSQFHADPAIVGKTLWIGAQPATVIGVAPDGFELSHPGLQPVPLWMPRAASPTDAIGQGDELFQWYALGRRRAEHSLADVQAELSQLVADRSRNKTFLLDVYVQPLQAALVNEARTPLLVRFGAVALVFLTICSNVAGLLLVRAQARRGEFATRVALGATRARLFRQLALETLVPFLLAWPLSALVAAGLVSAFRDFSVSPSGALAHVDVSLDRWALLFSLGASLVAGLISAWVPALTAARTDLLSVLRQAGTGAPASSGSLLRPALVVAQIALAFALSTVAGLALSALLSTLQVPAGFEPRGLVSAHLVGFTDLYAADEARGREILARISELIRKTAGVRSVAANTSLPLAGYEAEVELQIEGRAAPADASSSVQWNAVTEGYFDTLGTPILEGRGVLSSDGRDAAPVALISRRLAEQYFPRENPIGRRIKPLQYGADRFREIVGVVGDVRRQGLGNAVAPEVYVPLEQEPGAAVLVARSDQPQLLLDALPSLVGSVEPSLGVRSTRLDERMRATLREPYQLTIVLGAFAGVALLLASLALYSLVARASMVRTRELAIRTALGSPPGRLIWLVMRGGLTWLLSGAFIGLALAWGIGHWMTWAISGGSAFDARVYGGVSSLLGAAGLLASFVPAWRATRMSLPDALKCE